MFSSLHSRLWLSYAFIIVTALGVVAMVLFIYLLRNPLLYRQTSERLKAVQAVVLQRESQSQPVSVAAQGFAHLTCASFVLKIGSYFRHIFKQEVPCLSRKN